MIENFLLKKFQTGTFGEIVWIEEIDPNDYILCNRNGHLANIEKITAKGFKWYGFFVGKHVKGSFTFEFIEKNLVPVTDKEPAHSITSNTTTKP